MIPPQFTSLGVIKRMIVISTNTTDWLRHIGNSKTQPCVVNKQSLRRKHILRRYLSPLKVSQPHLARARCLETLSLCSTLYHQAQFMQLLCNLGPVDRLCDQSSRMIQKTKCFWGPIARSRRCTNRSKKRVFKPVCLSWMSASSERFVTLG